MSDHFIHLTKEAHNLCRLNVTSETEIFQIPGTALSLHLERFPKSLGIEDGYMTIIETMSICTSCHLRRSLTNLHQKCLQQPTHFTTHTFLPSQAQKLTPVSLDSGYHAQSS